MKRQRSVTPEPSSSKRGQQKPALRNSDKVIKITWNQLLGLDKNAHDRAQWARHYIRYLMISDHDHGPYPSMATKDVNVNTAYTDYAKGKSPKEPNGKYYQIKLNITNFNIFNPRLCENGINFTIGKI